MQVGAALALLGRRQPSGAELAAFAGVLAAAARPFPRAAAPVLDTCGTGGDGSDTPNLSTLAALLLAHLGVPVLKHGNRAATSLCGSADLLEHLGFDLARSAEALAGDLAARRFAFLFAPAYHPALGPLREIRTRLGIPTVFNLLGPLLNPGRPEHQILGVAKAELARPMAEALAGGGVRRAFVVHGQDAAGRGLDEASTEGPTLVLEVRDGRVLPPQTLQARELGLAPPAPDALKVADRAGAFAAAHGLLAGRTDGRFRPAVADGVALQAGLGLVLHRGEGLEALPARLREARAALDSGFELPLPQVNP
jgi:anthranilate phosphoribosyltransferase